ACWMGLGRMETAIERARAAIEIAQATWAPDVESHARCTLGVCLVERGDIDAGIAGARTARDLAENVGHPELLDRAYGNLSHVLMTAGRLDDTAALVKNPA